MSNTLVEIKNDTPVIIIDGYVTINLPQFNLKIVQKVKGTKGRGVADADYLKDLNEYHKILCEVLLKEQNKNRVWTVDDLLNNVKLHLYFANEAMYRKFNPNHWRRPISELLRKKILVHYQNYKTKYQADVQLAQSAKNVGVFN